MINEFQVNELGIGRFPLLAEYGNDYNITINYLNKEHNFNLNHIIEPIGVTLSVVQHRNKAIVTLMTNEESLKTLKSKTHQLTIHNGTEINVMDIVFDNETTIIKAFDLNTIPAGVNIFTFFNENNKPIIERLFFNYNGIDIVKSNAISAKKSLDSILINLNFKTIDSKKLNNISISVLPKETQSYNSHHNIISYNLLKPYIKGNIENASYYFSEISEEKKIELDNLLITQGWSSYDWDAIFNTNQELNYNFEQGISIKANINKSLNSETTYMVHSVDNQSPRFFEVSDSENSFKIENVFISEKDSLYLSKIVSNKRLEPAELYLQASPSNIPQLYINEHILKSKSPYYIEATSTNNTLIPSKSNNIEELDEVVVIAERDKIKIRTRELSAHSYGKVAVVSHNDRLSFYSLSQYLASKMIRIFESDSTRSIGYYGRGGPMHVFLDDIPLNDNSLVSHMLLSDVDYVEINRSGLGEGFRGLHGVIKIYTNNKSAYQSSNKKTLQNYKLPLTFSANKKFYAPKYQYYNDTFYNGYGTIDWKPELVTDANGNITMKIAQPEVPITLFIEGIANDGSFIFEEKTISLN